MEELFNEFVNEHLFKLSVGVGVAYAGVLIAMGIDFVFGIKKARELKIDRTSTGFKMTATKAQKYFSPMLCLTVVDAITSVYVPVPAFTLLWACYCCFCEFRSVTEKSWKKKELRDAANTMKVIIENKDDFAKVLAEILKEKEVINETGTK
ncbi:hypothetical protein [Butyricimonas virosa]|uniref:hypothetical protein n=1 Tax=Butyricimonas virosa TaxID=544645 RepID=UPI00242CABC2|nr:hypothetical protein [Butyricimonas virosa]